MRPPQPYATTMKRWLFQVTHKKLQVSRPRELFYINMKRENVA